MREQVGDRETGQGMVKEIDEGRMGGTGGGEGGTGGQV